MILEAFRLNGRVALVTGAARGMGQAIARGLAEAGADLLLLDCLSLGASQEQIAALGRRVHCLDYDLLTLTPSEAADIVATGVDSFGRLDILVNNAGIIRRKPAVDAGPAEWDEVLQVNLTSAFLLSQAVARHFMATKQQGKIINVTSLLSLQGGLSVPGYTAAKSGLAGLTRALANEWAPHGINVNALAPGYMATEFTAALRDDPERGMQLVARIPAGRWGEPSDVQGAVVFLASDAALYVHGITLPVDGGWLAW